jgi:hypothetical protein
VDLLTGYVSDSLSGKLQPEVDKRIVRASGVGAR